MVRRLLPRSPTARRLTLAVVSVAAAAAAFAPVPREVPRLNAAALRTAVVPTPEPLPASTPVPAFRPVRIEIPALGVSAPIVPVGVDADGAMGTPKTGTDVGWWEGLDAGAGNALFAGHKDWNGRPGSFYGLGRLREGDVVTILGETARLDFAVQWITQMPGDGEAEHILGDVGAPVVTLITCGGEFDRRVRHYKDRVIVRAVLA